MKNFITKNKKINFYENFARYLRIKFFIKVSSINILAAKSILLIFFFWKYNSRDFSFFSYLSDLFVYPIEVYSNSGAGHYFGFKYLFDIFSFHFIHWFIDYPTSVNFFKFLYYLTNFFLIFAFFFGFLKKKIVGIILYILLVYQWSYIFNHGQEIDAVAIFFGILLVLSLFDYKNLNFFHFFKKKTYTDCSKKNGFVYSCMLLVFIFYYFSSGINKITDITFAQWFKYDLFYSIKNSIILFEYNSQHIPSFFSYLLPLEKIMNVTYLNILPVLVYLSHLCIPIIFFKRSLTIVTFTIFYIGFHLMTYGVGISFTGYLLSWFMIINYSSWINKNEN